MEGKAQTVKYTKEDGGLRRIILSKYLNFSL